MYRPLAHARGYLARDYLEMAVWRVGSPSVIALSTACFLVTGMLAFLAWRLTGNLAWVIEFFRVPAALMMIWLAMLQCTLSFNASRSFAPDDLLRRGWTLITLSAGCQLVGSLLSQVLGVDSRLNPLVHELASPEWLIPELRSVGLAIGGTFRFALLSAGLHYAVKAYRQSGFLGRLKATDWGLLGLMAVFLALNGATVTSAIRRGNPPNFWHVLNWPTDPLLGVLLAQGLLLLRSAQKMGSGMLGRCWKAFAVGLFLTVLGDVADWAGDRGFLPWPWLSLSWYVWLPAATAFACAPAFQSDVIRRAISGANGATEIAV